MKDLIAEITYYIKTNNISLREDLKHWEELINEYSGINQIILNYFRTNKIKEKNYDNVYQYIFKIIKPNKLDLLKITSKNTSNTNIELNRVEGLDNYILSLNNVNNKIYKLKKCLKNNENNIDKIELKIEELKKVSQYLANKIMAHGDYLHRLNTLKIDYISRFDYSKADELDVLLDDIYIESLLKFRVEDNIKIKNPEQILYNWLFKRKPITKRGKKGKVRINAIDHFFWYKERKIGRAHV